jgi:hypothetical protein
VESHTARNSYFPEPHRRFQSSDREHMQSPPSFGLGGGGISQQNIQSSAEGRRWLIFFTTSGNLTFLPTHVFPISATVSKLLCKLLPLTESYRKEKLFNILVLQMQCLWRHLFYGNISDLKYLATARFITLLVLLEITNSNRHL